jgi:hypothetical protein
MRPLAAGSRAARAGRGRARRPGGYPHASARAVCGLTVADLGPLALPRACRQWKVSGGRCAIRWRQLHCGAPCRSARRAGDWWARASRALVLQSRRLWHARQQQQPRTTCSGRWLRRSCVAHASVLKRRPHLPNRLVRYESWHARVCVYLCVCTCLCLSVCAMMLTRVPCTAWWAWALPACDKLGAEPGGPAVWATAAVAAAAVRAGQLLPWSLVQVAVGIDLGGDEDHDTGCVHGLLSALAWLAPDSARPAAGATAGVCAYWRRVHTHTH